MIVFILEDNKDRIRFFNEKLALHDLFITDNVEIFIEKLKTTKPDFLFLDHDLDGKCFVNSNEPNTGSALARYIYNSDAIYDNIVIHSMNTYGAEYMASLLKGKTKHLIVMPFPELMENME